MYQLKGPVPAGEYTIPFGVADVKRAGNDITLVATSSMVQVALAAAETLLASGISAEVVDVRTTAPLDKQTLIESAKKTSRAIVIDEGYEGYGATAEIASGSPTAHSIISTRRSSAWERCTCRYRFHRCSKIRPCRRRKRSPKRHGGYATRIDEVRSKSSMVQSFQGSLRMERLERREPWNKELGYGLKTFGLMAVDWESASISSACARIAWVASWPRSRNRS